MAAALWMDMGLGKTVVTLTAIQQLIHSVDVHRVLVTAPLRVARKTWLDEIKAWPHLSELTMEIAAGSGAERRQRAIESDARITTINFANVKWLVDQYKPKGARTLLQPWPWDTIVADESQAYRDQASGRTMALKRIRPHVDRFYQLTGTPAPAGLHGLWAQSWFLDGGGRLGNTLTAFRKRWFKPPGKYENQFKWTPLPFAQDEIQDLMNDLCLTMLADDYLDLPPIQYIDVPVTMNSAQLKTYHEMERKYVTSIAGQRITAVNAGVLCGKLCQLANGAAYYVEQAERRYQPFHNLKTEALLEIINASTSPVMVFYEFQFDFERIIAALAQNKERKLNWRKLNREQDEDDWNNGKIDVLLLHPASGGHGLNLHFTGETIVWYGLTWSLELYQQAIARLAGGLRRIGKNVRVHTIMTEETRDFDMATALAEHDDVQLRLMRAMKLVA
jgi:SNF2 family DNA or RNA helicase